MPGFRTIHAIVRRGERQYVAECVEIAVVTQGATLDETADNLREAIALHLEGEVVSALGLPAEPSIHLLIELDLVGP